LITQSAQAEGRTRGKWEDNTEIGLKELNVTFDSRGRDFEKYLSCT